MNIIILANADLESNYALNLLLPEIKQHNLRLYLSAKVGGKTRSGAELPQALQQLKFFEQTLFNQIIFPLLEKSASSTSSNFKTFNQFDIFLEQPVKVISSINSTSIISEFKDFQTDLIISIRFGLILKNDIIGCCRYGVINLHSGRLPEFQGVMPTFRAMLKGDAQICTTLHYISNSKIDQGDIISTFAFPLDKTQSYLWNLLKLYEGGYKTIITAIEELQINGKLNASPQQGVSTYFSFPHTSEIDEFSDKGFKLFDIEEINEIVSLYIRDIT